MKVIAILLLGFVSRSQQKTSWPGDAITKLAQEEVDQIKNHAFIFVGGIARSGTSFMRHIVKSASFASGMDSCENTTNCRQFSYEGQWLLLQGQVKGIYKPGNYNHLTEANFTKDFPSERISAFLFSSWKRYWDLSKPVLVEKSPPNILKMRWLAGAFQSAAQIRFVNIIRHPALIVHFEHPRKCLDGSNFDKCEATALMQTRVSYAEKWIDVHNTLVSHLKSWKGSESMVAIIRYEQSTQPCTCQRIFQFCFLGNEKLLEYAKEESVVCAKAPQCDFEPAKGPGALANETAENIRLRAQLSDLKAQLATLSGNSSGISQARRLGYKGSKNPLETASFNTDTTSSKRAEIWGKFLRDHRNGFEERLETIERNLKQFGYSLEQPLENLYRDPESSTDVLNRWSLMKS